MFRIVSLSYFKPSSSFKMSNYHFGKSTISSLRISRADQFYDGYFRGMQRQLYKIRNIGSYDDQTGEILAIP